MLPAARALYERTTQDEGRLLHASGFNRTINAPDADGCIAGGEFGLDQGIIVLMLENYRSGLLWRVGRTCPYIQLGLRRAGFTGGWL